MLFLWLKVLHLIAIVIWFSGLFYLPRLFVYHAMAIGDAIGQARFKIMEHKLYYYITIPGMIAVLISGIGLLCLKPELLYQDWLRVKLCCVALLIAYHHLCGYYLKQFAKDNNRHSHKFFRFFNEVPSLLLIVIIILAVIRPF